MTLMAYRFWRFTTVPLHHKPTAEAFADPARSVAIPGGRVVHRTYDPRWNADGDVAMTLCGRQQAVSADDSGRAECRSCSLEEKAYSRWRHYACQTCGRRGTRSGFCDTHYKAEQVRAIREQQRVDAARATVDDVTRQITEHGRARAALMPLSRPVDVLWPWHGPLRAICAQAARGSGPVGDIDETGRRQPTHRVPDTHCDCGIYAVIGPHHLDLLSEQDSYLRRGVALFGRVELWGRVQPHQRGYRAEYALPVALYDTANPADLQAVARVRLAAKAYQLPLLPMADVYEQGAS